MVDLFSSTIGFSLLCDIFFQLGWKYVLISYLVTKMYSKAPKLDGSDHPILELTEPNLYPSRILCFCLENLNQIYLSKLGWLILVIQF